MATTKKTKITSTPKKTFFDIATASHIAQYMGIAKGVGVDMPDSKASGTKTKNKRTAGNGNVAPAVNAVSSPAPTKTHERKPMTAEINIIKMPKVGNYTRAYLSKWHVAVGDKISEGDVIAGFEMGWVEKTYQSRFTGEVLELLVNECELIYEGKPICVMKCEVENDDNSANNTAETGFALLLIGIRDKCKGKVVECIKNIMGIGTAKAESFTSGLYEYGNTNLARILMTGISRDLANVYAEQLREAGANVKVVVAGNAEFICHYK